MSGDAQLVSVITPVLDGEAYLEGCIESVLSQSYPDIEHIFVDGGSRDGTLATLETYAAGFPRRVRFVVEPGTGPGEAWNIGLKMAKGDIFGCIGVDDLCEPGAIEIVVEFFRSHPDAFFLHGSCDVINDRGDLILRHRVEEFNSRVFVNTAKHIATPSAFYRRAVMEKIGWLDASGDDFDVMIRIAKEFRVYKIDQVLSKLRIRTNSAFNPSAFERRRDAYEKTYRVSRRHGGRVLSPIGMRYYTAVILGWLHLGSYLPALRLTYRRIRGMRWKDGAV